MKEPDPLPRLLHDLGVPQGGILYVCSSMDWSSALNQSAVEIVEALRAWLGPEGTLVMPSLARLRRVCEYMQGDPVFDVRKTPTQVGMIPEVFRRMPEVQRSLHPYLSAAALGPQAHDLTGEHHLDVNPVGPQSPFFRISRSPSFLLGLGVTLNTNIFVHVVDETLNQESPLSVPLYHPGLFSGTVIDAEGQSVRVSTRVIHQDVLDKVQPRTIVESVQPQPDWCRILTIGRSIFFGLDIPAFMNLALTLGRDDLKQGKQPRWHAYHSARSD